jgi:hypothetical protein
MKVTPSSTFSNLTGVVALTAAFFVLAAGCSSDQTSAPSLDRRGSSAGSGASSSLPTSPIAGADAAAASGSAGAAAPSGIAGTGAVPSQPVSPVSSAGSGVPTLPAMSCARGTQTTDPVTPTVWLVVDGSTSMDQDFEAGRSRWDALRATLMGPGGVVESLQATVRFGMVLYAGGDDNATACTQLVTVDPALNNLAAIAAKYPAQPVAPGTPTDKALDEVVSNLAVTNMAVLDMRTDPVYVVLATDGSPNDNCGNGVLGGGRGNNAVVEQNVIDITARGTAAGMDMFVISLAGSDTRLQAHLAKVADATASRTPPFAPATQNDLIAAFRKIVGGATCQVALVGSVMQGRECDGKVLLNGTALPCNDANGWKMLDDRTVQLSGNACTNFTSKQSFVEATFPCDVFTPD